MRSLLVLGLASLGFAGFLYATFARARTVTQREAKALVRVGELVKAASREAREEGGYAFAWETGANLPELLVARPLHPGETGWRWFAAQPDGTVWQYEALSFHTPAGGPDLVPLRRYLLLAAPGEAAAGDAAPGPPLGWQRVE